MFKAWQAFWSSRSRRREKAQQSQHIESTFAERLASNSRTKHTSKIDLGFTSQTDLNEPKPRRTFSGFFDQLWKGLRNSKRRPNAEETRRSVVFTIPTDEIFPKCSTVTKRQTQRLDQHTHVVEMDGLVTQLCAADVHTIPEEEYTEKSLDVGCSSSENVLKEQQGSDELAENNVKEMESNNIETNNLRVDDQFSTNDVPSDDEKYLSKESDIENDSGFGSSCHEITSAGELFLPLTVTTLSGALAQISPQNNSLESLGKEQTTLSSRGVLVQGNNDNSILSKEQKLSRHSISKEGILLDNIGEGSEKLSDNIDCLHKQVLKEEQVGLEGDDSFLALIQLAKQGMSNETHDSKEAINTMSSLKKDEIDSFERFETIITAPEISDNDHQTQCHTECDHPQFKSIQIDCSVDVETSTITPMATTDDNHFSQKTQKRHVSFGGDDKYSVEENTINNNIADVTFQETIQNKDHSIEPSPTPERYSALNDANSTDTEDKEKHTTYLKVPSIENIATTEQIRRPRSFSATIRRRLSLSRSSQQSASFDDSVTVESREQITKTKKIKAFGSFRMNNGKKSKSTSSEQRGHDLSGELKGYTCTFDQIFSEDIHDNEVFSDVPFTIPEMTDQ